LIKFKILKHGTALELYFFMNRGRLKWWLCYLKFELYSVPANHVVLDLIIHPDLLLKNHSDNQWIKKVATDHTVMAGTRHAHSEKLRQGGAGRWAEVPFAVKLEQLWLYVPHRATGSDRGKAQPFPSLGFPCRCPRHTQVTPNHTDDWSTHSGFRKLHAPSIHHSIMHQGRHKATREGHWQASRPTCNPSSSCSEPVTGRLSVTTLLAAATAEAAKGELKYTVATIWSSRRQSQTCRSE